MNGIEKKFTECERNVKNLNIHDGLGFEQQIDRVGHVAFWSPTGSTVVRNRFIYDALWTERQSGGRFLLIRRLCGQEAPDENSRRHEYVCASGSTFFK
jgi:hypothetical protein